MFPISINTFIVVANPTMNAPGAACETPSKTVLPIVLASMLETMPHPNAIIKKTPESSTICQFKLKTPYRITISPVIKIPRTDQFLLFRVYLSICFDKFKFWMLRPMAKLLEGSQ